MLDFFVGGYVAQDFLSGHGRPLCLLETTMLLMHKVLLYIDICLSRPWLWMRKCSNLHVRGLVGQRVDS